MPLFHPRHTLSAPVRAKLAHDTLAMVVVVVVVPNFPFAEFACAGAGADVGAFGCAGPASADKFALIKHFTPACRATLVMGLVDGF